MTSKKGIHRNFKTICLASVLAVIMSSAPSLSFQNAYAAEYGYQAIKPSGSFTEIKSVKGEVYTYLNSISIDGKHIDRMIYMTDTNDYTMGVGYYNSQSSGNESYKWLKYQDNGSINDNFHWLSSTGPSSETWKTLEVIETSTDTFDFKVGGSSIGTKTCDPSCPNLLYAGAVAWGSGTGSDHDVDTGFQKLEFKRNNDSVFKDWNSNYNTKKCANFPDSSGEVGFNWPTANNINEVWIDVVTADDCEFTDGTEVAGWLYNDGAGG